MGHCALASGDAASASATKDRVWRSRFGSNAGSVILRAMTQAGYRIIPVGSGFKVEINRPGETVHVAVGFESEADAKSWIEEDKRITGINDRQRPIEPPHLRKV